MTRLVDIDNIVFMTGRGNGKTIVADTVRRILESLPTVEAIPIDWIINHDQMPKEGKGHDAIMDMINTWKEERKGEKTMKKTITFYELLQMIKDGNAPEKVCFDGLEWILTNDMSDYYHREKKFLSEYFGNTLYMRDFVEYKVIIYEATILTDKEKAYLSAVLEPFKDRVSYVRKYCTVDESCYYLHIEMNNEAFSLPAFGKYTGMYSSMKVNHAYTPLELGLWKKTE